MPDALTLVTQRRHRPPSSSTRTWVDKVEKRYRAYRGIAEKRTRGEAGLALEADHAYILQVAEGMLATMMDPKPTWT